MRITIYVDAKNRTFIVAMNNKTYRAHRAQCLHVVGPAGPGRASEATQAAGSPVHIASECSKRLRERAKRAFQF